MKGIGLNTAWVTVSLWPALSLTPPPLPLGEGLCSLLPEGEGPGMRVEGHMQPHQLPTFNVK
jgi:hypothetical protein